MAFTQTDNFEALKQTIQEDIIIPGDQGYHDSLKRWSKLAQKSAGAVAFVKTNKDVLQVIDYVVKNNIDLAIKGIFLLLVSPKVLSNHIGGWHNPSGASSFEGGIVIDLLKYMTSLNMDIDAKVVNVGAGALWADVDAVTSPAGYGTVGGTVSHVCLDSFDIYRELTDRLE